MEIPQQILLHIADYLPGDEDRLKLDWIGGIVLKDYYDVDDIEKYSNFIIRNIKIKRLGDFDKIKNTDMIENIDLSDFSYFYCEQNRKKYTTAVNKLQNRLKEFKYLKNIKSIINKSKEIDIMSNTEFLSKKITHLEFHDHFENEIELLGRFTNLAHLRFGCRFNRSIASLKDLRNLTHLTFGMHFDQDITPLQNLINLRYLTFDKLSNFNQNITPLQNLKNLTHLTFGNMFNRDITPLQNLTNLIHLKFGCFFNQDIDLLEDLKNLKYLRISRSYEDTVYDYVNINVNVDFF